MISLKKKKKKEELTFFVPPEDVATCVYYIMVGTDFFLFLLGSKSKGWRETPSFSLYICTGKKVVGGEVIFRTRITVGLYFCKINHISTKRLMERY